MSISKQFRFRKQLQVLRDLGLLEFLGSGSYRLRYNHHTLSFNYELDFVRRRYNRLAYIYPLFNIVLALPFGFRTRIVQRLDLQPGDKVLEVACGTGRNLPHLVKAVGPSGEVFGIDYSEGMLAKARKLCARNRWRNVTLLQQDAAELLLPKQVDGVLFSLCYSVMPKPREALARAWNYLQPGRQIVIADGKFARGTLGRLSRPFVNLLSKATVLGDINERPWEDLRKFTPQIEMEEINFGTYFICRGTKL